MDHPNFPVRIDRRDYCFFSYPLSPCTIYPINLFPFSEENFIAVRCTLYINHVCTSRLSLISSHIFVLFFFVYPHNVMLHFYSDCNNLVTFVRVKTWMKSPTSTSTRFLIYQSKSVKTNAAWARCTKPDHSFMLSLIDQWSCQV